MIMTTTNSIDGQPVEEYLGIVMGEAIIGANIFKDLFAAVRDVVGGRAQAPTRTRFGPPARRRSARWGLRAREVGANAVIGIDIDYEVLGKAGSMLMVTSAGTAVRLS